MRAVDIIAKKRDGGELTREEIAFFIQGFVKSDIADYQAAAWLMAVYLQGMTRRETSELTQEMALSGETLDLRDITDYVVDKHSSGGVGDKTSLVVLPLVASCGVPVAKMSGRGLGYSGGTIDKLEAIKGYRADLTAEEFHQLAKTNGIVLAGQSASLAPADGKLYALRDVTATVSCQPLIASSIMSKKIAAGANGIVLDVKMGRGAFMETLEKAQALARMMVEIGQDSGLDVTAIISDMNQPLGEAVGNALEVKEAVATLHDEGPADFRDHCMLVAREMLRLAGRGRHWQDDAETQALLRERIKSGAAYAKFRLMVEAQGGDVRMIDNPELLPNTEIVQPVLSPQAGTIANVDAHLVAKSAFELGAGREKKTDSIDLAVGVKVYVKVGDQVQRGQVIAEIFASDFDKANSSRALLQDAFEYSETPVPRLPLYYDLVRSG